MQRIDMTGRRYGLLTVLEYYGYDKPGGVAMWKCQCDCGNTTTVLGKNLRQGRTKSCGCLMLKRYREVKTHA